MDRTRDHELALLLALAQQGDGPAYEAFLLGACEVLRPYLARRVRERDQAEEVLQDTLLSIHRARQSYLPGRPVGPWLYAICQHRIADFDRQRRRRARVDLRGIEASARATDHLYAHPYAQPPVVALEALGRLPGRQRRVIELLKLRDLSVREVAHQVGMTESAVKVTAFRGYQALRKMMGANRK